MISLNIVRHTTCKSGKLWFHKILQELSLLLFKRDSVSGALVDCPMTEALAAQIQPIVVPLGKTLNPKLSCSALHGSHPLVCECL